MGVAAFAIFVASCSSGTSTPDAAPPRQFTDTTTTATAPPTTITTTTTRPGPQTPLIPVITTTPITRAGGAVTATLESVDGRGDATIRLPPEISRPAIVHAQHDGAGPFTVSAIDAGGASLGIVAQSTGSYSGTFPIGFVDEPGHPTSGLTVTTPDAWHLDISQAVLAPKLAAPGVAGHGDAVLAYQGPAVSAHVTASGRAPFTVHVYDRGNAALVTNTDGPYDAHIPLPAGPVFISVTAAADWSMSLG